MSIGVVVGGAVGVLGGSDDRRFDASLSDVEFADLVVEVVAGEVDPVVRPSGQLDGQCLHCPNCIEHTFDTQPLTSNDATQFRAGGTGLRQPDPGQPRGHQKNEDWPVVSPAGATGIGVRSGPRAATTAATAAWNRRARLGESRFSG